MTPLDFVQYIILVILIFTTAYFPVSFAFLTFKLRSVRKAILGWSGLGITALAGFCLFLVAFVTLDIMYIQDIPFSAGGSLLIFSLVCLFVSPNLIVYNVKKLTKIERRFDRLVIEGDLRSTALGRFAILLFQFGLLGLGLYAGQVIQILFAANFKEIRGMDLLFVWAVILIAVGQVLFRQNLEENRIAIQKNSVTIIIDFKDE